MEKVYKYKQVYGIIEYNIIKGKFGDSTLHLQDITCNHYGQKCEIEVIKCDNSDCYQFSKSLNSSAELYECFHKLEKFWATKREAYIDAIQIKIENCQKHIEYDKKTISDTQEKLASIDCGDGEGDHIILVEDKNICKIVSEYGDIVFLSDIDNYNNENNNKIAYLNKIIENSQRKIEILTTKLNNLCDALNKKNTLTIDELMVIANS